MRPTTPSEMRPDPPARGKPDSRQLDAQTILQTGEESGGRTNWRRRKAIGRITAAYMSLWNKLGIKELENIARHSEEAVKPTAASAGGNAFVEKFSPGQRPSPAQRLRLEIENQRQYFQQRRTLLENALTSSQVAALLGTSRQTPHDRFKAGSLIAMEENGKLLFPSWQFDAAGPNGVVRGLPDVIRALDVSSESKLRWLIRPNAGLEGFSPIDLLKRGEVRRVVDAARAVGVS